MMTHFERYEESKEFIKRLDETIKRYSLLDHPFYQAWNKGTLSKEALANYAKQYYVHVKTFPTYLSAVHSRCEDMEVRQLLLENMIDEEHGDENHPELWLRFAEGLGVERDDVRSAQPLAKTTESVNALKRLTTSDNYLEGVAALYAYESQVPAIARTKREGLRDNYDISDERTVSYFSVHEEADLVHREQELDILVSGADDEALKGKVLEAAETSAKAMWTFLDGVYEAYCEPRAA